MAFTLLRLLDNAHRSRFAVNVPDCTSQIIVICSPFIVCFEKAQGVDYVSTGHPSMERQTSGVAGERSGLQRIVSHSGLVHATLQNPFSLYTGCALAFSSTSLSLFLSHSLYRSPPPSLSGRYYRITIPIHM